VPYSHELKETRAVARRGLRASSLHHFNRRNDVGGTSLTCYGPFAYVKKLSSTPVSVAAERHSVGLTAGVCSCTAYAVCARFRAPDCSAVATACSPAAGRRSVCHPAAAGVWQLQHRSPGPATGLPTRLHVRSLSIRTCAPPRRASRASSSPCASGAYGNQRALNPESKFQSVSRSVSST
jgi:hypothetical protein